MKQLFYEGFFPLSSPGIGFSPMVPTPHYGHGVSVGTHWFISGGWHGGQGYLLMKPAVYTTSFLQCGVVGHVQFYDMECSDRIQLIADGSVHRVTKNPMDRCSIFFFNQGEE